MALDWKLTQGIVTRVSRFSAARPTRSTANELEILAGLTAQQVADVMNEVLESTTVSSDRDIREFQGLRALIQGGNIVGFLEAMQAEFENHANTYLQRLLESTHTDDIDEFRSVEFTRKIFGASIEAARRGVLNKSLIEDQPITMFRRHRGSRFPGKGHYPEDPANITNRPGYNLHLNTHIPYASNTYSARYKAQLIARARLGDFAAQEELEARFRSPSTIGYGEGRQRLPTGSVEYRGRFSDGAYSIDYRHRGFIHLHDHPSGDAVPVTTYQAVHAPRRLNKDLYKPHFIKDQQAVAHVFTYGRDADKEDIHRAMNLYRKKLRTYGILASRSYANKVVYEELEAAGFFGFIRRATESMLTARSMAHENIHRHAFGVDTVGRTQIPRRSRTHIYNQQAKALQLLLHRLAKANQYIIKRQRRQALEKLFTKELRLPTNIAKQLSRAYLGHPAMNNVFKDYALEASYDTFNKFQTPRAWEHHTGKWYPKNHWSRLTKKDLRIIGGRFAQQYGGLFVTEKILKGHYKKFRQQLPAKDNFKPTKTRLGAKQDAQAAKKQAQQSRAARRALATAAAKRPPKAPQTLKAKTLKGEVTFDNAGKFIEGSIMRQLAVLTQNVNVAMQQHGNAIFAKSQQRCPYNFPVKGWPEGSYFVTADYPAKAIANVGTKGHVESTLFDTGQLKASGKINVSTHIKRVSKVFSYPESNINIEYTAPYALRIHESVGRKFKYGQPKFLESAMKEEAPKLDGRIQAALKSGGF